MLRERHCQTSEHAFVWPGLRTCLIRKGLRLSRNLDLCRLNPFQIAWSWSSSCVTVLIFSRHQQWMVQDASAPNLLALRTSMLVSSCIQEHHECHINNSLLGPPGPQPAYCNIAGFKAWR
ncbi:hypothetical protein EJ03DRAFT_45093 [Teratosphaeria nubilosa]|uniref:Uncharacterized protein n=1 Tax=Teratosphaeria nubilosa TaxID=161662 RepID=A0A6G1LF74_9PEZI|nr:hypothetical protein EJ03DRAFT_45093 [Teratosphaeria nubilosa]